MASDVTIATLSGGTAIDYRKLKVDSNGNLLVTPGSTSLEVSATATLSNVSASASSVTILALNASRKGAHFFNDSTALAYVKFGSTASTTSFTQRMDPYSTLILECTPIYTGIVTCIWASATGDMRVTELT